MSTTQRYTLSKAERLKSRKEIEAIFKTGQSFGLFPFRVFYILEVGAVHDVAVGGMPLDGATVVTGAEVVPLQAGVGASGRNFKRAVDRNRIKRLMREAYRLQKHPLQALLQQRKGVLRCFVIYTGRELPAHRLVMEKMQVILKRLMQAVEGALPAA